MSVGLLSSAISGMQAAQLGLQTAGHNITNQNTDGYNRQRIVQATNIALQTGSGYVGQGVHVSTIERVYDSFLAKQINRTQTVSSELNTYYTQITQIDNMLADEDAGLSSALQDFFTGVQQVAANPSQVSSRQTMISSAQVLVARFNALEDRLQQMYEDVNNSMLTQVDAINSYARQVGELNQNIIIAQSSTNQPANDLLDQRDQLVAELNKLIQVTTTTNTDGSFNVFFGTGQQLVVGTQVMTMTAAPSAADSTRYAVGLVNNGSVQELPESLLTGGSLGGVLKFRSEAIDHTSNELGRNAASLALTFNAQYALGQNLLGQSVGDTGFVDSFFTLSGPVVIANTRNSMTSPAVVTATLSAPSVGGQYALTRDSAATAPFTYTLTRLCDGTSWSASGADVSSAIAALQANVPSSEGIVLGGAALNPGGATQVYGNAANSANFYTKLTASDYRLSYNGTDYTVLRLSDGASWSNTDLDDLSAQLSTSEGFSIALASGTMVNGDSFIIKPVDEAARNLAINSTTAADPRLINAATPFMTAATASNKGSGKISSGVALAGFGAASVPAGGVTLTYASATGNLTLSGVPAGVNVSVTVSGSTSVYAGPDIPYTSGATIAFSGVSFEISGNLDNGDSFSLGENTAGVSDARNALLLGKLQMQKTMSGATASYQTAYAQLVSYVGNKTRQLSVTGEAQAALLEQAQSARESLSGVNLDEEAANLIRYQQAYQASAKALQSGITLFDTLLGIMD